MCISFQPTEACVLAPVSPSRAGVIKNNSSLNYPIDFLRHNFIRLGLTRAKALQTVSRLPRETRRRYAAPKSNAFTLETNIILLFYETHMCQVIQSLRDSMKRPPPADFEKGNSYTIKIKFG